METLTGDYSLTSSLRIPATSLTNKKHNVQVRQTAACGRAVSSASPTIPGDKKRHGKVCSSSGNRESSFL